MKTTIIALLLAVALPMSAFGHGSVIELTDLSATAALTKFQAEETEPTLDDFNGIKAWPSGAVIKVKVYLKSSDALVYSCQMVHDGADEEMVCTKE